MTTADRLNDLITSKEDIKSAIEEKGVEVTGGLSSYADAIRQIESGTSSLIEVPINTLFIGSEWTTAPNIETPDWTNMSGMFSFCPSLTTVPLFDTRNVTNMSSMFYQCDSLTTITLFDTRNVTNMNYMFTDCDLLTTVPLYNTSNVTTMEEMFSGCSSLTTVPLFNTSKVTNMHWMFSFCPSLTTVPLFDTSNVTNMEEMFRKCDSLTTVPLFDTSNVTNISGMFTSCTSLTTVGGFKDLGKQSSLTNTYSMIDDCYNLTDKSILNIINNLYDRATAGYSVLTLKLHANVLALLSEDDIAIATNKGWTIA